RDSPSANSERLQSGLLLLLDIKESVQFSDLKYLVNLGIDVAQDQAAARRLQLLVQRDELAQRCAGEVFDVAEIEEELARPFLIDKTNQLLADVLDVLHVEDFAIDKVNDEDVPNGFNFQTTTARLGRHRLILPRCEIAASLRSPAG